MLHLKYSAPMTKAIVRRAVIRLLVVSTVSLLLGLNSLRAAKDSEVFIKPQWQVGDWWYVFGVTRSHIAPKRTLIYWDTIYTVTKKATIAGIPCFQVEEAKWHEPPGRMPTKRFLYFAESNLSWVGYQGTSQQGGVVTKVEQWRPPGIVSHPRDMSNGWPVFPLVNSQKLETKSRPEIKQPDGSILSIPPNKGSHDGFWSLQEVIAKTLRVREKDYRIFRVQVMEGPKTRENDVTTQFWLKGKSWWSYQIIDRPFGGFSRLFIDSQDTVPLDWSKTVFFGLKPQAIQVSLTPKRFRGSINNFTRGVRVRLKTINGKERTFWIFRINDAERLKVKQAAVKTTATGQSKNNTALQQLFKGENYQVLTEEKGGDWEAVKGILARNLRAPIEVIPRPRESDFR